MALSLATIRNGIITSIHGRRLGFDHNDVLVGTKAIKRPITDATSDTTGTALPNTGVVSVATTTDDTWTLTDPIAGCEVTLATGTTSTGTHTITPAAATILTSLGAAGDTITLIGGRASVTLLGLSTSQWKLTAATGTTVGTHVSS